MINARAEVMANRNAGAEARDGELARRDEGEASAVRKLGRGRDERARGGEALGARSAFLGSSAGRAREMLA